MRWNGHFIKAEVVEKPQKVASLNATDVKVRDLIMQARGDKEIARILDLTFDQVSHSVRRIQKAMQARNRVEIAIKGVMERCSCCSRCTSSPVPSEKSLDTASASQ